MFYFTCDRSLNEERLCCLVTIVIIVAYTVQLFNVDVVAYTDNVRPTTGLILLDFV